MDGSTASLIAIPIVSTLALAAWLILVAYAAAHPRWKHGAAAAAPARQARADAQVAAAGPRTAEPRIAVPAQSGSGQGQNAIPAVPAKLAA